MTAMIEERKAANMPHNLIMEERRSLTVSAVSDIERFDESEIVVVTEMGNLSIKGQGLHLNKIDVEDGELSVEGELDSISYSQRQEKGGSLLAKLFR